MLFLYVSGAFPRLIEMLIGFINKEYILYILLLKYISDACSETKMIIRVKNIRREL